jgi:tetratricopeptide (TPR) repeat protein
MSLLMSLLPLAAFLADALAQTPTPSCHKNHAARDYKMTAMPPPKKLTGIGNSHLKITTKSPEAQAWFDQGLNLHHCFWDFEEYRAFKEAARLDPDAAMAWWGIVQAIDPYPAMQDEKNAAIEKMKSLTSKASDHEQFYIRAYLRSKDNDDKDGYAREMEALVDKYPDDLDAKLLLGLSLDYGYERDGRPDKSALYPQLLVRDVLRARPDSAAAHHYMVHMLESSLHAEDAVPNARELTRLAPGSGHMIHMPGHIYYRIGQYDQARESFLASKKFEEDYMKREKLSTVDDWNYPHNLSYLIASDAESGRYKEALELATLVDGLPANPFLGAGSPQHAITIGSAAVRLKIRFGDYRAAVDHPVELGYSEEDAGQSATGFRDGMIAYARGMVALQKNDAVSAQHDSDALDAILWRLQSVKTDDKENKDDNPKRPSTILELYSLDLRGNLRAAQGRLDEAIDLLKKAADKEDISGYTEPPQYARPELEALGYVCIRAKKFEDAREAFRKEMKARPNSGHALYGIAQAYEEEGKRAEAARAYREFLDAWKGADRDLPMVRHAEAAAAAVQSR